MTAGDHVTVPAQDRVRVDQEPQSLQRGPGEWVQQGGEQRPVGGLEPDALVGELTLEHGDLVPQHKDLGVFILIARRQ